MAIVKIKVNDPQPLPCKKCEGYEGYGYSDTLKINYQSEHSPEGEYEGGNYSEFSETLRKSNIPYCINCGETLPFRLIREPGETV